MKRLWIGIIVLILLFAGGVGLAFGFSGLHGTLARDLEAASAAARQNHWLQATELVAKASSTWDRFRHFSAAFTDHEPLEQMDALFAQLKVLESIPLPADYAVLCTHLAQISRAIAESHILTWWNLL